MPRKTRSKKRTASDDEENQMEDSVANVNKRSAITKKSKQRKISTRSCAQEALMGAEDMEDNFVAIKKGERAKQNTKATTERNGRDRNFEMTETFETQAEISDNGQILSVAVNNPDDESDEANRNYV